MKLGGVECALYYILSSYAASLRSKLSLPLPSGSGYPIPSRIRFPRPTKALLSLSLSPSPSPKPWLGWRERRGRSKGRLPGERHTGCFLGGRSPGGPDQIEDANLDREINAASIAPRIAVGLGQIRGQRKLAGNAKLKEGRHIRFRVLPLLLQSVFGNENRQRWRGNDGSGDFFSGLDYEPTCASDTICHRSDTTPSISLDSGSGKCFLPFSDSRSNKL